MARFFVIIFCLSALFAEEADISSNVPSLSNDNSFPTVNIEGEPSAIVAGCVNVITGDFFDLQRDLIMVGGEPLVLERSYSSSDTSEGNLCNGWHFNLQGCLFADKHGENYVLKGSFGEELYFDNQSQHLHSKMYQKGFVNSASGIISGKTNIKNYALVGTDLTRTYQLNKGDGSFCLFKRKQRDGKFDIKRFCLQLEKRSSGIEQHYEYDHKYRLTNVTMQNRNLQSLQSISLEYPSRKNNRTRLTVKANDGRIIQYRFSSSKGKEMRVRYLKEALRPNAPNESYDYESLSGDNSVRRLVEKRRPDGRALQIKYYKLGDKIGKNKIHTGDINYDRVKCLLAPIGHDSTLHVSHYFQYETTSDDETAICHVLDAKGNHTKYTWDPSLRLTSISKMLASDQIYTVDKLFWGKDQNVGNLVSRVYGSLDNNLFCKTYEYDSFGNVLVERFYGHITGNNLAPLVINDEGMPIETGCDRHEKSYIYSQDGRNLLLKETEGSRSTAYRYYDQSDLVAVKYLLSHDQIMQRHCYCYDENCSLQSEVIDNGISDDPNDLTGATFRKLRLMTPRKTLPIGLPDTIEEYCHDLKTGEHLLQKALVNSYSIEGKLIKQDHYDSNRNFCYSLYWEYDGLGNVTKEVNALGQTIERRYDANGNKTFECGPNLDYHKIFAYDFSNRLVSVQEVHPDRTLSTHYRYNVLGQKEAVTDCYGNETKYVYDEFGRLVCIAAPSVSDNPEVELFPVTLVGYDHLGNKSMVMDPKGNTTLTAFTAKGMPNHIKHPDGTEEHFTYLLHGPVDQYLDRNGCLTKYYHDYQDRIIRTEFYTPQGALKWVTSATYDAFHLLSETDAMGNVTEYTYDVFGRKKSLACNEYLETYEYDELSRLAKKLVHYGYGADEVIVYSYQYDWLDRIVQSCTEDASGAIIEKTNTVYDVEGRVIFETSYNENGLNVTEARYDSHGTPVEVIDALGNTTKTLVRFDYQVGKQFVPYRETVDALGNITILIKDALGRDKTHICKNAFGEVTQHNTFSYDLNDNVEKIVETVFGNSSYEVTHLKTYDEMNRLKSTTEAFGTPEQRVTHYHYNNLGQLQSILKPSGTYIHHAYTEEGLLSRYLADDSSFHYTYAYDLNQNLIASNDENRGISTLRRYVQNQLVEEKQATGLTVKYAYDRMGRVTALTLPDESSIQYTYANVYLKDITRRNAAREPLYQHAYNKFDGSGNSTLQTLIGKAGRLSNSYDICNRLTARISEKTSERITSYDKVGNLLERELKNQNSTVHCKYAYDDLYQLKSEEGNANHTYQYDSTYNRIAKDDAGISYNHLNQIQAHGYEYDSDGRLIATPTSTYTYDALDRLTSVTKDGVTTRYSYDSFNRRLSKSDILFLYDGQREIGAYQNNKLIEFRTLAPNKSEIGAAIAIELENKTFAPIHDITGSVSALISADGKTTEIYRFTAFGEEISPNSNNPWRFASKRFDPESSLIYFGNRYYDPSLGRWITPDPIGYDDGPNLYAYVSNNPLTHFDAFGLFDEAQYEEDCKLAWESNSDVYDNPRDWFGNSRTEWQDVSFQTSFKDFNSGFGSGLIDPIGSFIDIGQTDFIHKNHGRLAGEAFGIGTNYVALEMLGMAVPSMITTTMRYVPRVSNFMARAGNSRLANNFAYSKVVELSKKSWQNIKNGLRLISRSNNKAFRTAPKNLAEKLTLAEAKANEGKVIDLVLKDPKYPSHTWCKKTYTHKNPDGSIIEVHYMENLITKSRELFKFKNN